jgi:glycosyltransferase involved in cell wall biosynthesis
MSNPLVTLGVPVYGGQDRLPELLECLKNQSYENIDVLISVDNRDQASADACKPFLEQDSRFRMEVQPVRLGWAGNTDWTMRHRRGDFFIYQQHDDLLSPTYVADLVEAAARWPNAAICFAKMEYVGQDIPEKDVPSLVGEPKARALTFMRRLDWEPFRGLIRGSALDKTSGLLLSDCDPFDSFGTEFRFMTELALAGEFRFVKGPIYFKNLHGENLSTKREGQSREYRVAAVACWTAWMIEVIVPVGATVPERYSLLMAVLERFAGRQDALRPLRSLLRRSERLKAAVQDLIRLEPPILRYRSRGECAIFLRQVFERLKSEDRFHPGECLDMTWSSFESACLRHYRIKSS